MALCIKRREFVSLLGGATVAWPFVALAQKPDRMRRIGVLMSLDENDIEGKAQLSGFTQGLADLGWSNGSNLRMEVRWGGGDVRERVGRPAARPDPRARNSGDRGPAAGDADNPHRVCRRHRPGRRGIRCGTALARREYHRFYNIRIRDGE